VVVADADPERAKATAAALTGAGLETVLAHDGVEAILAIQRLLPRAAVLDAALPKMLSFQVCELMKRNESLRTIAVVLVGEPDARTRGASAAAESYGADAYLEPTEMPAAALGTLRRLGLPLTCSPSGADAAAASAPSPPPPASMPAPGPRRPSSAAPGPLGPAPVAPAPVAPPSPEQAPSGARPDSGEQSQAERLARIIVSDIVLYNEEKFAAAVQAGNVLDAMQAELEEARTLFRDRIDARVREQRDFLGQEIQRVARSRGMR
jgi:CheY-like chemotaxis protein